MDRFPETFHRVVGELPEAGRLPSGQEFPFGTLRPVRDGFIERKGVKSWYAVYGESGPWIAFAPIFQISHTQMLKATVPYLAEHFRVFTMDLRGNGRSDRPRGQEHYAFDEYYGDFLAALDAAGVDCCAVIGISATAMTALRFAAEHPERVSHVVVAGGYAQSRIDDPQIAERVRSESERMRADWPKYLEWFFSLLFPEPHSTKPFEDGVRYGWAASGELVDWGRNGWLKSDVSELAKRVKCPTLVIHGDADKRVPIERGRAIQGLVPGSRMLTLKLAMALSSASATFTRSTGTRAGRPYT